MPAVDTKYFGEIPYESASEIEFPCGLPAFEQSGKFVLIRLVKTDPLLFLQSLEERDLRFPAMRTLAVDPHHQLRLAKEDLRRLNLSGSRQPRVGEEIECRRWWRYGRAVINLRRMQAVQAVVGNAYSAQRPLRPPGKAPHAHDVAPRSEVI